MDSERTGKFIKTQRIKHELTQKELAERLAVEPQTVSKWERGAGVPDTSLLVPLARIFGVSVEEILDPKEEPTDPAAPIETDDIIADLPAIVLPEGTEKNATSKKPSFADFFSAKRIKENAREFFGEKHEWKVNRKLLFGGVFHRHGRNEFERAATQGMFRDDPAHKNGIASPFLFFYLFLVCFICFTISIRIDPAIGFLFSSSMVVLPLLVFAYELEFPRTVGLLRAVFIVLIGGMGAILVAVSVNIFDLFLGDIALTLLAGPIEEFAKAVIVLAAIMILKPRYLLSGLLIGFCVGAGFTVFENIKYSSDSYLFDALWNLSQIEDETEFAAAINAAGESAVWTGLHRSIDDLFIGHHFWAAIYGGAVVLCKKDKLLSGKHIFDRNVVTVFLICVAMHTSFNGIVSIGTWWSEVLALAAVGFCTLMLFNRMLNVGLHQYEVSEEYRRFLEERETEEEPAPDDAPVDGEPASGSDGVPASV